VLVRRGVCISELLPQPKAGIAHQKINRPLDARQPLRNADHITTHGQVGDDLLHADPMAFLQFGRHPGEPIAIACDQYKIIATRRERPRKGGSDA
jgi:hypothetical protein